MVGLSPSLLLLKNLESDNETLAEDSLKILPMGAGGRVCVQKQSQEKRPRAGAECS